MEMRALAAFLLILSSCLAAAQNAPPASMPGMTMPGASSDAVMEHSHVSSGSAWQPLSVPMHVWSQQANGWTLMEHGALFLTYNQQGGPRGISKLESTNWLMLMQQHALAKGTLQFREMLSAEPLTVPHGGFPELFQTGETYHGIPLVDRQHPHDVFGELAALYSLPLGERVEWEFYGGPAGEPAFGPATYLHRASASEMEAAPLGHHLQDSTHISYGVVTSGLVFRTGESSAIRVEGSAFNGREPDEDRVDIDLAALDSFSGRVTFDPKRNWSMQYSYAHLVHPEATEATNIDRQTASVSYNRPLPAWRGNWSSTLLWGRNHKLATGSNQNSYLAESVLNFRRLNYAFTRLELVDKDELFENIPVPAVFARGRSFRVGAFAFGAVRDVVHNQRGQMGVGADLTFYSKPDILSPQWGRDPVSLHIFLRFRPGEATASH
jgi:hypothetical protein